MEIGGVYKLRNPDHRKILDLPLTCKSDKIIILDIIKENAWIESTDESKCMYKIKFLIDGNIVHSYFSIYTFEMYFENVNLMS